MNHNELASYFRLGLSKSYDFEPFWKYLKLLVKWNEKINLTSSSDPQRIIEEHFIDSLMILPSLEIAGDFCSAAKILDIGSGAGFPGIPLKLALVYPHLTLAESIKKKADFIKEVSRSLHLSNLFVLNERVSPTTDLDRFDLIVSRGTIDLSSLIEVGIPHLNESGRIIVLKGEDIQAEISSSEKIMDQFNLDIDIRPYSLPYSKKRRNVAVLKRGAD